MIKDIVNSVTSKIVFRNRTFFIKRDDLLHEDFTGNKARKFYYFFKNDFPHIKKIISYGSNQSNAMYSLSVLCKLKGWEFEYYTNHIPTYLKQNPQGNLKGALDNGMKLKVEDLPILNSSKNTLIINEGGAIDEASYGIEILANEIMSWKQQNNIKDLKIFLPSGTGTTALFLQKYLNFEVLTCPCVGNMDYLKKQFFQLESNETYHPTILKPYKKFHFGKLYKENYKLWQELKDKTKIEFDLLYDPIGWQVLLDYPQDNTPILYIHQGGLKGNETMIKRYERK
jgi:1-aminocyclopropane-1-carboxylate deaminase/D-cysteine desulfhydrase-like pyridoxal-dependent ACC family enzyme